MWNFSHTSTWTQMCIPGSTLVISLALGAVNDIMRQAAVNTPDWWTAETAKRLGVSVGGPRSLARVLPNGDSNEKVEFHSLLRFNKHVLDCWDWLEHLGLLSLFEQRQLTSQILFTRQPMSWICIINIWLSDVCFAKSNTHCGVCHSVFIYLCENSIFLQMFVRLSAHYIRTFKGISQAFIILQFSKI